MGAYVYSILVKYTVVSFIAGHLVTIHDTHITPYTSLASNNNERKLIRLFHMNPVFFQPSARVRFRSSLNWQHDQRFYVFTNTYLGSIWRCLI